MSRITEGSLVYFEEISITYAIRSRTHREIITITLIQTKITKKNQKEIG